MSQLDDAVTRYNKLLESGPFSDLAWAEALHERMESGKLSAGGRLICPFLRPNFISRRQYDSLDFEQIVWASVLTAPEKIADIRSPEQFVRFLVGVARNKVAHAGRHMEARKNDVGREVRLDDAGDIAGPHPISRDPTPSAAAIGRRRTRERMTADMAHLAHAFLGRMRIGS
jgi:hypothetical protein